VDKKKLGQLLLVVLGLALGLYAVVAILLNPTGGISGLSKLITIVGLVIGIVNPRAGIYFLALQAMYSDEIKRVAVYYGVTSQLTVQEVLIGPILSICAINASFIYGVLRGKYSLGRLGWLMYLIIPIIAIGLLIGGTSDSTRTLKLYNSATICLYITLVPVCYGLFNSFDEWVKFVSTQVLLATPATAWGIWQYYNGFNIVEWTYGLSGLSPTHTGQMLLSHKPRIFGLFGSASAYGCVAIYGAFAIWRGFRFRNWRYLFLLLGVVFLIASVLSEQRSLLLYPFIILGFAMAFRRFSTTALTYLTIAIVFILGIFNATYLLNEGLDKINNAIAVDTPWGNSVLQVSTFSDRLFGWERLGKAESWTLFGNKEEIDSSSDARAGQNHDIVNKVLINYGALALFAGVFFVGAIFFTLHKVIFRVRDLQMKKDGAFVMACVVPVIIMSFIAGDNFSTTPTNLQIWSVFAGIFVIRKITQEQRSVAPLQLPSSSTATRTGPMGKASVVH
jgi:hypothetical protein